MADVTTLSPVKEREPRTGGRGPRPPRSYDRGGGGGGGRGDGWKDDRLRRARFGMLLTVIAIGMLFVSLASVYFVRESSYLYRPDDGVYGRVWEPVHLPVRLLLLNTLVLLGSSITLEIARRKLRREAASGWNAADNSHYSSAWLMITVVLGFSFLDGQWMAWRQLQSHGAMAGANPATSFFYLLTGTHAVHLAAGLVALVVAAAMAVLRRGLKRRAMVLEVTAMYWHFMGVLWVALFALMYFVP